MVITSLTLGAANLFAGAFEDGREANLTGNYQKALAPLLPQNLTVRDSKEGGLHQDYKKTADWWRLRAESGTAESPYKLDLRYARGFGVEKGGGEAAKLDEKTTSQHQIKQKGDDGLFTKIHNEEWIKQQNPEHYFLHLIILPSKEFVDKFFEMYPLQENEKAYFISRKDNKEVYNIIYGVYKDRGAALRGLDSLPEGLRKKSPMIRDYASVQDYVIKTGATTKPK